MILLPFMEQDSLYRSFNLSEPWDSPTNIKLLGKMPSVFGCANKTAEREAGRTKSVAITGPGTFFPGATSARFSDATDGLGQTIMLAEIGNLDVPWTAPVDLDIRTMSLRINDRAKPGISGPHPAGQTICTGEGMLRQVPRSIPPETLRALLTVAGGEAVDLNRAIPSRH